MGDGGPGRYLISSKFHIHLHRALKHHTLPYAAHYPMFSGLPGGEDGLHILKAVNDVVDLTDVLQGDHLLEDFRDETIPVCRRVQERIVRAYRRLSHRQVI
jgi:hypothetical protein